MTVSKMPKTEKRRQPGAARNHILKAAESLALDLGAAHLTMDAVAARAKISKGGLLHHFPTKSALIKGMLDQLLTSFRHDIEMIDRLAGPSLKEQLRALIRLTRTADEKLDRLSVALLTAAANEPRLLRPFVELLRERLDRLGRQTRTFGLASSVLFALDGYWLFSILGLNAMPGREADAFFDALTTLVDETDWQRKEI